MRGGIVYAAIVLLGIAQQAGAQRVGIASGDVQLEFTGRLQMQFSGTSVDDEEAGREVASSSFDTRRIRFAAVLTIQDWLSGMLETEFAGGRARLRHAYLSYEISEVFGIRVGQYKKPFSMVELHSSTTFPAIERGLRIRGLGDAWAESDDGSGGARLLSQVNGDPLVGDEYELLSLLGYAGYELGASIRGASGRFSYEAGVFNGNGDAGSDNDDAKSFALRGQLDVGSDGGATIGAAVSHHSVAEDLDGTAVEADFELGAFKQQGMHVMAEVATGSAIVADASFLGLHALLSWYYPLDGGRAEGWEVVGRVSYGDPNLDVDGDAGTLLTPGVTVHFFGRNRLMLNWEIFVPHGDRFDTHHGVRAMAQLHF